MPELIKPEDLQPGDVLQHLGQGDLSTLIAWVGDSRYSHSALVADRDELVEAAPGGVRRVPLAERAAHMEAYHYIDVYRPLQPTATQALAAIVAASDPWLGTPYPMTSLLLLGLACTLRNKLPREPGLRMLVRDALDQVIERDTGQVVCSELVWRAFDEAASDPAHAWRLPVVDYPWQDTPFPDVDIPRLLREVYGMPAAAAQAAGGQGRIDQAALEARLAAARAAVGLDGLEAAAAARDPNPRLVLPGDLEHSPGLRCVGRLRMRPMPEPVPA